MIAAVVAVALSFGLFTAKDALFPPPTPVCKIDQSSISEIASALKASNPITYVKKD